MKTFQLPSGISLTSSGIFVRNHLFLPLVLDSVKKIIHQNPADSKPSVSLDCVFYLLTPLENSISSTSDASLDPATLLRTPIPLIYDETDSISNLKEIFTICHFGLESQCPSKKIFFAIMSEIFQFLKFEPSIPTEYVAAFSGWQEIQNHWVFITSGFGIRADGPYSNLYCSTKNAHLLYDSELPAAVAFQRLITQTKGQFFSIAPILAVVSLSLLSPLRPWLSYPAPGLLLTGPPQSGKTMCASLFGQIFSSHLGALNTFILQEGLKKLKSYTNGLANGTFLLDDVRRSPSSSINEKIFFVLDTFVRESFQDGKLLPVITGESGSLTSMPDSWKSRVVEIPFSEQDTQSRRELIRYFKENPLLVRTCFYHFIKFLAENFKTGGLIPLTQEIETRFSKVLPRLDGDGRCYDNFLLLFWAFKIFVQFGIACQAITAESGQSLLDDFVDVIKKLQAIQQQQNSKTRASLLLNSLILKMTIHTATERTFTYKKTQTAYFASPYYNTYGHTVCIDSDRHYAGVFLQNSHFIMGYPPELPPKSLLIVKKSALEIAFKVFFEELKCCGIAPPYHSLTEFLKQARSERLLLVTPRHENQNTRKTNMVYGDYLEYKDGQFTQCSVYVFELDCQIQALVEKSIEKNSESSCWKNSIYSPQTSSEGDICAEQIQSLGRRLMSLTYG